MHELLAVLPSQLAIFPPPSASPRSSLPSSFSSPAATGGGTTSSSRSKSITHSANISRLRQESYDSGSDTDGGGSSRTFASVPDVALKGKLRGKEKAAMSQSGPCVTPDSPTPTYV